MRSSSLNERHSWSQPPTNNALLEISFGDAEGTTGNSLRIWRSDLKRPWRFPTTSTKYLMAPPLQPFEKWKEGGSLEGRTNWKGYRRGGRLSSCPQEDCRILKGS